MPRTKFYDKPQPSRRASTDTGDAVAASLSELTEETPLSVESTELQDEIQELRKTIEELIFVTKLTNGL